MENNVLIWSKKPLFLPIVLLAALLAFPAAAAHALAEASSVRGTAFASVPGKTAARARPHLNGENVVVYYDESTAHHAERVKNAYPALLAAAESKTGWKIKCSPSIFLVGSESEFNRMGGDDSIAAFALIGKAKIVVDLSSFDLYLTLDEVLRHEITHLLLHDYIPKDMPDWAEEGICEWVGGAASIGPIGVDDYLAAFSLYRNSAPLSQLREFSEDDERLELAYTQSGSFIRFIAQRHGDAGMRQVLERLRQGEDIERALFALTSKSVAALESEWRGELAYRTRWLLRIEEAARAARGWGRSALVPILANRQKALLYLALLVLLLATWRTLARAMRR